MQVKTTVRYSASKMNKILTQASTRTNPEGIILAELSQSPEERAVSQEALERQIQGPRADGGAGLGRRAERPVFGGDRAPIQGDGESRRRGRGWLHNDASVLSTTELKGARCFPGGPVEKSPPANAGDTGSIPGPGRPHVLRGN